MSKQSEAKKQQGYTMIHNSCTNCKHLTQNFFYYDAKYVRIEGKNPDTKEYARQTYSDNLRCGIGEFAVKKTASCAIHAMTL